MRIVLMTEKDSKTYFHSVQIRNLQHVFIVVMDMNLAT